MIRWPTPICFSNALIKSFLCGSRPSIIGSTAFNGSPPHDGGFDFAAHHAESLALHGCALLVTGSTEQGLDLLSQAHQIASDQVKKDGGNDYFVHIRVVVAAFRALAFTHWSNDPTSTVT